MEEMPNAGDPFQVTESEKEARAISTKRQELKRFEDAKAVKKVTLDNLYSTIEQNEIKEFKVIIKADLQGSAEALKTSLEKLSTRDIRLVVIHSSAGAINESDVTLAAADSNAIIIGFNVCPTPKAKALADQERVEIRKYNIIYKAVEEIQAAMEGMLSPEKGCIDAPIARALPSIILRHVAPDGKSARTHYQTEQTDGTHTLLRLRLETGRTHQIRVHLAYLGHPLLGDDLYGGNADEIKRHALHSARLTLSHPRTQKMLVLESPLPPDMARIAKQLR